MQSRARLSIRFIKPIRPSAKLPSSKRPRRIRRHKDAESILEKKHPRNRKRIKLGVNILCPKPDIELLSSPQTTNSPSSSIILQTHEKKNPCLSHCNTLFSRRVYQILRTCASTDTYRFLQTSVERMARYTSCWRIITI